MQPGYSYNLISGNTISANNEDGITLVADDCYNTISNNAVHDNMIGIELWNNYDNTVSGNNVSNNHYGIETAFYAHDNKIYHNNFVGNDINWYSRQDSRQNIWDNGYPSGGNYWSDYSGVDQKSGSGQNVTSSDGIGDTPYPIDSNNTDRYPLVAPFNTFNAGIWNNKSYSVGTVSNSTLSNFNFTPNAKTLSFNVAGTSGTMGFCRVAIPKTLMWCADLEDWVVTVNGTQVLPPNLNITTDANYTYVYFSYHHSTEAVQIQSTGVVPEFQLLMLLPLFMMITLLTATVSKKKRNVRAR
jgi:parallel beta-helix repeat protein